MPHGVSLLTNLQLLDLSSNGFHNIDVDFSGMTRLNSLIIQDGLVGLAEIEQENQKPMVLSETISALHSLTKLDLTCSMLLELPTEIGQLHNLETLDLTGCMLTALPVSISKLAKLKTLQAQSNQLTEIVQDVGEMRSLTDLNLYKNDISSIPDSICTLPQLRSLFVNGDFHVATPIGFDAFIASNNVKYN